jgi:hypothetical protein
MDKIYSHGWGKNILTCKRNNTPYVFHESNWYNLSKWVYECEDFDGEFANLFHEDPTIRRRVEMKLADVLVRGSIMTAEESRLTDADGRSAGYKSYKGPRIKRKKTLRITLREMVIIVYEHRAKVLAWKNPKVTARMAMLDKQHSAAEEPLPEEPPAPAEPVVTEYDVEDWEELAELE